MKFKGNLLSPERTIIPEYRPFVPNVFLGMPFYSVDHINLFSAQALWQMASRNQQCRIILQSGSGSSSLPTSFNELLIGALNARDYGVETGEEEIVDGARRKKKIFITHLAMVHSDIAPQMFWVDALWEEMKKHNADAISAVSPIKEHSHQLTSTAIGKLSDEWYEPDYITMDDRKGLPDTFCTKDIISNPDLIYKQKEVYVPDDDALMLINTGCMLLDLRKPYWDNTGNGEPFAFEFKSRITKENGERKKWFRPEDWEMSRMLHKNKARYYATWKVRLGHFGIASWDSGGPQ